MTIITLKVDILSIKCCIYLFVNPSWSFHFIEIGEIIDHHNVSFFHYFQIGDKLHETIISIFLLLKDYLLYA
jgi:hypothetical protein